MKFETYKAKHNLGYLDHIDLGLHNQWIEIYADNYHGHIHRIHFTYVRDIAELEWRPLTELRHIG